MKRWFLNSRGHHSGLPVPLIDNIGEFEVYTDTLALQQLGELSALSM